MNSTHFRNIFLLHLALLTPLFSAKEVEVLAEVDHARLAEQRPVEGRIEIVHKRSQPIDGKSFKMGKEPLLVELLTQKQTDGDTTTRNPDPTLLSLYRFQLPPHPIGLHLLPQISMIIGDQLYHSIPTTFEVSPTVNSPSLKLEIALEKLGELHPGQLFSLRTRFFFDRNIELTAEKLPLLPEEAFEKVGKESERDYDEGIYSVRETTQRYRSLKEGEYQLPSSFIEGYVYKIDPFGKRNYEKPRLKAESSSFTILVKDFPQSGRPPSFNGITAPFTLKSELLTANKMKIGERLELAINLATPEENLSLQMVDISCQPGFSGFFQFDPFPPIERKEGRETTFIVALRPLSSLIREIPSIEASYFDPAKESYSVVRTPPIPIEVEPFISEAPSDSVMVAGERGFGTIGLAERVKENLKSVDWRFWLGKAQEHSATTIYRLTADDLYEVDATMRPIWQLLTIFIIASSLFLPLFHYLRKREIARSGAKKSQELLKEAMEAKKQPVLFFQRIERALLELLREKGYEVSPSLAPEALPLGGATGAVRTFLLTLQKERFSGKQPPSTSRIGWQAKRLYWRIWFQKQR